jgi:hypothetical protein
MTIFDELRSEVRDHLDEEEHGTFQLAGKLWWEREQLWASPAPHEPPLPPHSTEVLLLPVEVGYLRDRRRPIACRVAAHLSRARPAGYRFAFSGWV